MFIRGGKFYSWSKESALSRRFRKTGQASGNLKRNKPDKEGLAQTCRSVLKTTAGRRAKGTQLGPDFLHSQLPGDQPPQDGND